MSFRIWPLLITVVIVSCNNSDSPMERINKKLKLDSEKGFTKDIPKEYNDSATYWAVVRRARDRFGLPSIENGSEIFQIRVWEELDTVNTVLVLRYEDTSWTAKSYIYQGFSTDGHNMDSIATHSVQLGEPKSGWSRFLNKVLDDGILELNDESTIPGYLEATDQKIVAVEIGAKNYYKYCELPGVYRQPKTIKDVKSMVEILTTIKEEFPQLPQK